MQSVSNSIAISDVRPKKLMEFLADGHGYKWCVLVRRPAVVIEGISTRSMFPTLLIIGNNLLVWDGDTDFDRRLERTIRLLTDGGKSIG